MPREDELSWLQITIGVILFIIPMVVVFWAVK